MSSDDIDILLKVVIAICMGGIIGIEREIAKKPAGIRTHMFVSGASALVMGLSTALINDFARDIGNVQSDPVRVIEAIIVGISFIGAGTVLKSEKSHNVYYLTTAASILFAACIGITVGLDKYWLGLALTGIVVVTNLAVGNLEQKYLGKGRTDDGNHK